MSEDTVLSKVTHELLQEAIRSGEDDPNLVVADFDVTSATSKGENFLGCLLRASVSLESSSGTRKDSVVEKRSLILKCIPTDGVQQEYIRAANLFPIEIEVYQKTLPEMYKLLKRKHWDTTKTYSAKFLYTTPETDVIVLEDLISSGFKMATRQNGLDLDHCNLVLKSLATFHAASIPLIENDPSSMRLFQEGIFKESTREFLETYVTSSARALVDELQKWPDFRERYTEKLNNFIDTCWEKISKAVRRDDHSFNVLNHGDLWVNNTMFHYSETGKVDELRFIDFQNVVYTSPAVDLLYFLHSSPSDTVRELNYDSLIQTYHDELCLVLDSLGYVSRAPTLKQLKTDMENRMSVALFAAICELPNILAASGAGYDIEQYFTSDGEKPKENNTYAGETYKKTIQRLLPLFEINGAL